MSVQLVTVTTRLNPREGRGVPIRSWRYISTEKTGCNTALCCEQKIGFWRITATINTAGVKSNLKASNNLQHLALNQFHLI